MYVQYINDLGERTVPRNAIQFQKGLSEVDFHDQYGAESQCIEALEGWRWPGGFVCPQCGHGKSHRLPSRARLQQCAKCRHQTSVTAGTIMHGTKLPLTTWFRAMYHLTQSKNGISALEMMRKLGVSYNTAWKVKQKLMQVMKEREASVVLNQRVEMDDAYLGGQRARIPGQSGRGAPGKTPFVAAVETDEAGKPLRMVLQVVTGFTTAEIRDFALRKLNSTAEVFTDGLACFGAVIDAGCSHTQCISGGGRKAAEEPTFKWVNTCLGNIKSALSGTYRHLDGKHAPRYLAEFQYRFNRRYDLASLMGRLAWASVRTPPMPYHLLRLAESRT